MLVKIGITGVQGHIQPNYSQLYFLWSVCLKCSSLFFSSSPLGWGVVWCCSRLQSKNFKGREPFFLNFICMLCWLLTHDYYCYDLILLMHSKFVSFWPPNSMCTIPSCNTGYIKKWWGLGSHPRDYTQTESKTFMSKSEITLKQRPKPLP